MRSFNLRVLCPGIFYLSVALVISLLVPACSDNDDSPGAPEDDPVVFSGITMTDESGTMLTLDPEDWKLGCTTINSNIYIPAKCRTIAGPTLGETACGDIPVWNYSDAPATVTFTIGSGFQSTPAELTLDPGEKQSVTICHLVEAEGTSADLQLFTSPCNVTNLMTVNVFHDPPGGPEFVGCCWENSIPPAYPNPCSVSTNLGLYLVGQGNQMVTWEIWETPAKRIRTFHDVSGNRPPGILSFVWDTLDDTGQPVADGIYRLVITIDGDEFFGDIQVQR